MKLTLSHQMREIDSISINNYKISSLDLMENAGNQVAKIVLSKMGREIPVVVVCGKGNNGGDGLVVARRLIEEGMKVETVLLSETLSNDAEVNLKRLQEKKGKIFVFGDESTVSGLAEVLDRSKCVVDAIFGTGLENEIKGHYLKAIRIINSKTKPVFAVDIPSGLSSDTGLALGEAVRARVTVTFGLPKLGMVLHPGAEYVRELHVVDIGFPKDLIEKYETGYNLITPDIFKHYFGERKADSHKGDFGHVLVLAGSTGKMGAGWLTSKTALRSGAGLVTFGLAEGAFSKFDAKFAEVMVEPIPDKGRGYLIPESVEHIRKLLAGKDVVALGPGLGTHKETQVAIISLIPRLGVPLIVDADGLNNISDGLYVLSKRRGITVFTPHPGEMARLTKKDTKAVLKDRIYLTKGFAKQFGVFVVLKGNRTIIATPAGEIFINPTGNPGMASAGMGDVLTGMIAAFIGQKIPALEAITAAVYIHGLAGDIASERNTEIGMIASDAIEAIPDAIKMVRQWEGTQRVL